VTTNSGKIEPGKTSTTGGTSSGGSDVYAPGAPSTPTYSVVAQLTYPLPQDDTLSGARGLVNNSGVNTTLGLISGGSEVSTPITIQQSNTALDDAGGAFSRFFQFKKNGEVLVYGVDFDQVKITKIGDINISGGGSVEIPSSLIGLATGQLGYQQISSDGKWMRFGTTFAVKSAGYWFLRSGRDSYKATYEIYNGATKLATVTDTIDPNISIAAPVFDSGALPEVPGGSDITIGNGEIATVNTDTTIEGDIVVGTGGAITVGTSATLTVNGAVEVTGGTLEVSGIVAGTDGEITVTGGTIEFKAGAKVTGDVVINIENGAFKADETLWGSGADAFWSDNENGKIVYNKDATAGYGTTTVIGTGTAAAVVLTEGTITQSKDKFQLDVGGVATVNAFRIAAGDELVIAGDLTVAGPVLINGTLKVDDTGTMVGNSNSASLVIGATGILDVGNEAKAVELFAGITTPATAGSGIVTYTKTDGGTLVFTVGAKVIREKDAGSSLSASLPAGFAWIEDEGTGVYTLTYTAAS
jgi:hypothetical protein